MMLWQIFYGDDSTFSNEDGEPENAPGRNVIAIVCPDPIQKWLIVSRFDYYVWRDDGWYGVNLFGLFDYLIDQGWHTVKFGRTIPNSEFQRIHEKANLLKRKLLDG